MTQSTPALNLIIWSKDRPMQLNLCLESLRKHFKEFNNSHISVVYRSMDEKTTKAYDVLRREWSELGKQEGFNIGFIYDTNFYLATRMAFGYAEQTMFVVDDQVFVRDFSVTDEPFELQRKNVNKYFTISLRLDPTKTFCYPANEPQAVPSLTAKTDNSIAWKFANAQHDWGYPFSLDGNVYFTKPIHELFSKINPQQLSNPNTFEMVFNQIQKTNQIQYPPEIVAYTEAKTATVPVNVVQQTFNNLHANTYSVAELLQKWNEGLKIDLDEAAAKLLNTRSPHAPIEFTFIQR